jgi:hypothetical protein
VLWGCETWVLKEEEKRMLEVFHQRVIRRILRMSRQRIREERIPKSTMMNLVNGGVLK